MLCHPFESLHDFREYRLDSSGRIWSKGVTAEKGVTSIRYDFKVFVSDLSDALIRMSREKGED